MAQGIRVVIVGVVIDIAVAIWSTRALGSLLFGVGALDPEESAARITMFVAMAALLIVARLVAC